MASHSFADIPCLIIGGDIMEELQEHMLGFMRVLNELNNSEGIKNLIEADISDLDDEIENDRLIKNLILAFRDFVPATNRVCSAYFEVYQKIMKEAGELE